MNKYVVWYGKPAAEGTVFEAASSFAARQAGANLWGKPVGEIMARRLDETTARAGDKMRPA